MIFLPVIRSVRAMLFVALLFAATASAFAQDQIEGGLYAEHFQLGYRSQQQFGGILHIPFGDRFTANYQLGIGPSQQGGFFIHAPAGAVAGAFLLSNANGGELFNYLGVLMFVLPEGVGMYVTDNERMRAHVSLNPLGFEYWHRNNPYEEIAKMSGNVVLRLKMHTNLPVPTYIAPQIAGTWIYTPGQTRERFGFRAGVTMGYESKE
jgi:hypothetical protein